MSKPQRGASRQPELFARSTRPTIEIDPKHRLAVLERTIDWTDLEERAHLIRCMKLKSAAGRPPHLRALNGAMVLMASRSMSFREAEEQIRHYGPARLLCGLTETDWTPDHNTLADYARQMGAEGMKMFNEYAVELAVKEKLAEPNVLVADTTAQEAAIAHPNEMGLMASFITAVGTASQKAGEKLKQFAEQVDEQMKAAKKKVREYRLFTKKESAEETKQAKKRIVEDMASLVEGVQDALGEALDKGASQVEKLRNYGKVAHRKLEALHETMKTLLPQIRFWLKKGKVAVDKIINLHIPELYSIVRGKAGKAVEFGIKWGVRRIQGGYVLLTMAGQRSDLVDTNFAVSAVDEHIELFGKPPISYAYDRGGWSEQNAQTLKKRGVAKVGLAPRGQAKWQVCEDDIQVLVNERSKVEGSIGALKNPRYGFNRPRARSVEMMGLCGQRAAFGHNLNKLVRGLLKQKRWEMVG